MNAVRALVRRLVGVHWLVVLGHYSALPAAAAAVAIRVVLVVTGSLAWAYLVVLALLPFVLALLAHGCGGICDRGRCAVLISAQPSAEAERQRYWLWWTHHQFRSRLTWALLAWWAVFTFVIVMPLMTIPPVLLTLWLGLHAIQTHSRLRPWCPWCNGRGGDDRPDEAPPPGGDGRVVSRETERHELVSKR